MTKILAKIELYIFHDYQIAVSFWVNKQTRPRLHVLGNFDLISLPAEIPRDIAFIPSILRANKAVIVKGLFQDL